MINLKYIVVLCAASPLPWLMSLLTWSSYTLDLVSFLLEPPLTEYEFIVVGSGSAGSVVAGRLAQAGHSVLLVEAGGASPFLAHIPAFVPYNQLSPFDWQYKTEKVDNANLAMDGVSRWPRGKVLGGSSMLNYMIYMRGHSADYDEWKSLGVDGWSFEEVLPFFKKSENYVDHLPENNRFHGKGGPLSVSGKSFVDPIANTFVQAGEEMGYKIGDMNGEGEGGVFSFTPATLKQGKRTGTYKAFAENEVGRNLRVMTQAHVTRLIIEGDTVTGVEVRRFWSTEIISASKEVILSAGSIGTPQILMLSGIGDAKHLQEVGIQPVLHNPAVGANLQDHLAVILYLTAPPELLLDPLGALKPKNIFDYATAGEGPLTTLGGCGGNAFINTNINNDTRPDIQLHFASFSWQVDYGLHLRHMTGLNDACYEWLDSHGPGAMLVPVLSRPESRGSIKLRSKDPFAHPIIRPNYLEKEADVETLAAGLQFSRKLLDTPAFRAVGAKPYSPDPFCKHEQFESFEYYKCYVRHFGSTLYHPVGTAAMGTVLDSQLRLKGLKNLRVADGSVIPKIMGGNTNAPIIMVGERAADFIIKEWSGKEHKLKKTEEKTTKTEL